MLNFSEDDREDGSQSETAAAKPARPRGLLPQALEELQSSMEELRVAEEEMRVQNEEIRLGRVRLEAERQRYQDLFEFAPDGYLVTTADGVILEANRAASRLLGISPRFLKKRSLGTLIAATSLAEFQPQLKALTGGGSGLSGEWTVSLRRRPSGTFPAAVTAVLYQGMLGQPPTLRWLIRDITERQRAEEDRIALARAQAARIEAEASHRRTTEILETIIDQFVALDSQWRIVSLNASAVSLIQAAGHDPDSLIGQVLWEVIPNALGSPFQAEAARAVETGRRSEYEAFSEGLSRWLHVHVLPTESGMSVYANDITERKDAEAALNAAYTRERRIAETLQQILLHTPPPDAYPGLAIETFYEAASEEAAIGGDFSDVFTYDSGKIALVVGDISGKGLGAATLIAEVKYALRTILRDNPWPETAMFRLNNFVCEAQRQGDLGSEHQVVLSLAVFDPKAHVLSYVTAGGEALLLLRAGGAVETPGNNGLLLGVQPDVAYTAIETSMALGDTLLMVTDGLTEARRGRELLGFEGLQAQATQFRQAETLRGMGQYLIEAGRAWAGGKFQDDLCLLLARRLE